MNMLAFQLSCAGVVLLWVGLRARADPRPLAFLGRMALFAIGSWLAEETCIRAYGFYQYDPSWSIFISRLPLLVPLIWPVVLHSAWDLARALAPSASPFAIGALSGALVLTDAAFIEPICVASGLWSWKAPGLFEVPPIGVLGWAIFAALAIFTFDSQERKNIGPGTVALGVVLAAPLATHLALLGLWWGALRWISGTMDPMVGALLACGLSLGAAIVGWKIAHRIPRSALMMRVPAALVFATLLVMHAGDRAWLLIYAGAFALPYLAATMRPGPRPSSNSSPVDAS